MGSRSPRFMGNAVSVSARWAAYGALVALVGCGGGGGGSTPSTGGSGGGGGGSTPSSYTLGGTVSGLGNNSGLVLANGGTTVSVAAGASTFTFANSLTAGSSYSVAVQSAPAGLSCAVSNGSGTINANVTNIAVACTPQSFTLGGTVSGLGAATGLVVTNEGADATSVAANATSFTLTTPVQFGAAYQVAVQTNPTGLACSVTNGSGTMPGANVTSVQIACAAGTESVLHSFGGTGDGSSPAYGNLIQASDGNLYGMTESGGANGNGTVFKITPAGVETVLYSFAGGTTDGAIPWGGLIQASDGNLYGMTESGGAYGFGTVFKITTAGVETVLYSFNPGGTPADGANPYGNLVQASDGNLYGLTESGGANGDGTVFQITTAGVETVLHSFGASSSDGIFPYGSLIQASDGNLYGLTELGGSGNLGTLFKVTTTGTPYATVHAFTGGSGDGSEPYGSLVQASDGNLYGTTSLGGANNLGTAFKYVIGTNTLSLLHSFGGSGDGSKPYGSLIQASDGNLYGMTEVGGAGSQGTVFQISTSGTEAVVHSFAGSTNDGAMPQGTLVQASNGSIYGMAPQGGTNNVGVVFTIN